MLARTGPALVGSGMAGLLALAAIGFAGLAAPEAQAAVEMCLSVYPDTQPGL